MNSNKVIVVAGPTAAGKTALAISLAKAVGGEVISFDSMQVYQELSIATARPTVEEMQGIPHHLIGFLSVREPFSVADFKPLAEQTAKAVLSRGNVPIFVGGTGLYIDSLMQNIDFSARNHDEKVRRALEEECRHKGIDFLFEKLQAVDPQTAARLHKNNQKRVLRALEVYLVTGKTMTQQWQDSRKLKPIFDPLWIGVSCKDRAALYDRINRRVDQMLQNGLLEEVRAYYAIEDVKTASQAIGCKELKPYLDGEASLDMCVQQLKTETRRYAKRQLTWFRRNPQMHWLFTDTMEKDDLIQTAVTLAKQHLEEKEWQD